MRPDGPSAADQRRIDHLLLEFSAQPLEQEPFQELESLLRQTRAWGSLAGIYECRIEALDDPTAQHALSLRLADLLAHQLGAPEAALERYRQADALVPRDAATLAGIRRTLAELGDLRQALLVAEDEERLLAEPAARAELLAETGCWWQRLGSADLAGARFREALRLDSDCDRALAGLAELALQAGDDAAAAQWSQRRLALLTGSERAEVMEQLADLLPDSEPGRIRDLLRAVVEEFPDRLSALERLCHVERVHEEWDRVHQLQKRIWDLLPEEPGRVTWALRAASIQLDEAGSVERALEWAEAARRIDPDEARIHHFRASLFQLSAQPGGLLDALEALERIEGPLPERTLDIARLYERSGRFDRAAHVLRTLLVERPQEEAALVLLDRCLKALGQHADRLKVLEQRIRLCRHAPERAALETQLGELLERDLGDVHAAELAFRRAVGSWPTHRPAIDRLRALLGQPERAAVLADLLRDLAERAADTASRARLLCDLAAVERDLRQQPAVARDAYLAALEADRSCRPALAGLRAIATEQGDLRTLLEVCERELEQPLDTALRCQTLIELIGTAQELGDLPRALQAASEWAGLDTAAEPYRVLAEIARRARDRREEAHALENLEALSPDAEERARCLERLGDLCLEHADPGALERARDWYRAALALAPESEARAKLLDLFRRTGALAELAAELRVDIERREPEPSLPARLELARALLDLGDRAQAREQLAVAFDLDPRHAEIADLLDSLLEQAGEHGERIRRLRTRLAVPQKPEPRYVLSTHLAQLLLEQERDPGAAAEVARPLVVPARFDALEELYERALETGPDSEGLRAWLRRREPYLDGPDRISLLLRLAQLERARGETREALTCLRRAEGILPPDRFQLVERPLLELVGDLADPALANELLADLLHDAPDAATEAALRLERARLLAHALHRPQHARAELEAIPLDAPMRTCELEALARLAREVEAIQPRLRALEALTTSLEAPASLRFELIDLYLNGPESARDPARAETWLRELMQSSTESAEAFPRLCLLFERCGRLRELAELLRAELERDPAPTPARTPLVHRLAETYVAIDDLAGAIEVLTRETETGPPNDPLDELLCRVLEQAGDLDAQRALFEDRARRETGPRRARWLRRWLELLELRGEPLERRLEVVERLLELESNDAELRQLWIGLLRGRGDVGKLARALEGLLEGGTELSSGQRRTFSRELIRLYDGPLDDAYRALVHVRRALPADPTLRAQGIRLARRAGDLEAEVELLEPCVLPPGTGDACDALEASAECDAPADAGLGPMRRLALAYCELGRDADALPLLWRVHAAHPADREVLGALETRVRRSPDPRALLTLLEAHFPLETAEAQRPVAREAFGLAEELCDRAAALRWVRRWERLEPLPAEALARWVALERTTGDLPGAVRALRAQRLTSRDPEVRAESLAREAELLCELGQPRQAIAAYDQAVGESSLPKAGWLRELQRLLEASGDLDGRLRVLARIATHPHVPLEERSRAREERILQLQAHPLHRLQAADELLELIREDRSGDTARHLARMQQLLSLYARAGLTGDWAELARQLLPHLSGPDRTQLQVELARCWGSELGAHERARDAWRSILAEDPQHPEALVALIELCEPPGLEVERAELLERAAEAGVLDPAEAWSTAAQIRWSSLGDAPAARANVERALRARPGDLACHALRARLCEQQNDAAGEIESLAVLVATEDTGPDAVARWLRLAELHARDEASWDQAADAALRAVALLPPATAEAEAREPAAQRARTQARKVLEQIGDWERAAELLRTELEQWDGPPRPNRIRHLAQLEWDELRRAEETCALLERLEQVDAPDAQDLERWAEALSALGRWPEAVEQRRRALALLGSGATARAWLDLAELALTHGADLHQAHSACDRAESCDPESLDVLRLRVDLHRRAGHHAAQIEATVRLGERLPHGQDGAREMARAALLAHHELGDPARAWTLFRSALRRDAAWLPALLGAGGIARERSEWAEAERMYGMAALKLHDAEVPAEEFAEALELLEPDDTRPPLTRIATLAAEASFARGREPEALRYLEWALEACPSDASTLESLAMLSLRLGAYARARECLEAQLEAAPLAPEERVAQELRLAHACEGMGDLEGAAAALERVLARRPHDEVSRAHAIDLLERLGETDRALEQLETWNRASSDELRPGLFLRSARLEIAAGRESDARSRLEALVDSYPTCGTAWIELAGLTRTQPGPARCLELTERALLHVESPLDRTALLWIQAGAFEALGQIPAAVERAGEVLEAEPRHVEAAALLAKHLGHARDFGVAVLRLECALDGSDARTPLAASIWEALGRAYAGPLEDLAKAQLAYRRAIEANPLRSSAREALADVTAFDPTAHSESLRLHRDLLEAFPARIASWRALARIAAHWERPAASATCTHVLRTLGIASGPEPEPRAPFLVGTHDPSHPGVVAMTELLLALDEGEALPAPRASDLRSDLPAGLRMTLARLAGSAWILEDERIQRLFPGADAPPPSLAEDLPRRVRRRIRRAQERLTRDPVRPGDLEVWREELLAQAAACTLNAGRCTLPELCSALLREWPTTRAADPAACKDLTALIQTCGPLRALFLRIADATIAALPVENEPL